MKKCISILSFGILLTSVVFSCKKSSSSQSCVVASISDSTTSLQSVKLFTYDNVGRLTQLSTTGAGAGNKAYTYIGNMIVINVTDSSGTVTEIDSIVLNSFNEIQTYVYTYPSSDTIESGAYYYDASGIVSTSVESLNGVAEDTETYNTTNGDLNYELEKGQTVPIQNYTYYTQNIVSGDPTDIKQLYYYGAYYYKNAHMLNEFYSVGSFYNSYKYTFSNNRIAQVVSRQWRQGSADTVTHTMQYTYSCK